MRESVVKSDAVCDFLYAITVGVLFVGMATLALAGVDRLVNDNVTVDFILSPWKKEWVMPEVNAKAAARRFVAGDVVTTHESVTIYNKDGMCDGWALPGWKWRIELVTSYRNKVKYRVTAADAPGMYFATLFEKQIASKLE